VKYPKPSFLGEALPLHVELVLPQDLLAPDNTDADLVVPLLPLYLDIQDSSRQDGLNGQPGDAPNVSYSTRKDSEFIARDLHRSTSRLDRPDQRRTEPQRSRSSHPLTRAKNVLVNVSAVSVPNVSCAT
jgi:hypothetical protein